MKYEIKVIKTEELNANDERAMFRDKYDHVLFSADLNSDATIEILQHLYQLKERK